MKQLAVWWLIFILNLNSHNLDVSENRDEHQPPGSYNNGSATINFTYDNSGNIKVLPEIKTGVNHYALRLKLYLAALKTAYRELVKLAPLSLGA